MCLLLPIKKFPTIMTFSVHLKIPFNISYKTGLVVINFFNFCLSGKLSLLLFLMIILLDRIFFFFFFFLALWVYHVTFLWPVKFMLTNQHIAYWVSFYITVFFSWFLNSLFVIMYHHFNCNTCCCGPPWVQLIRGSLWFLYMDVQDEKFSAVIS